MQVSVLMIFCLYTVATIETKRRRDPMSSDTRTFKMGLSLNPLFDLKKNVHYSTDKDRYFYFVGDDGIIRLVDKEEEVDISVMEAYENDHENNQYLLFTRANRHTPQVLTFGDKRQIVTSNFDKSKTTVILVHGWQGNSTSKINTLLTKAFLDDSDVNVIVFDWSELASDKNYNVVKRGTAIVGKMLGRFINWLVQSKYATYDKIHLAGHSLGGHLVGNAGRETGGAVARITGMDPAGPLWEHDPERLRPSDAVYVEVIHTNIKIFGVLDTLSFGHSDQLGHADFYPNGGGAMPGCPMLPLVSKYTCSHGRSYEYMASSIKHNWFEAKRCAHMFEVEHDICNGPINLMGNTDLYKKG